MKRFWRWFPHKHLWHWHWNRMICTRCGRRYDEVHGLPWGNY